MMGKSGQSPDTHRTTYDGADHRSISNCRGGALTSRWRRVLNLPELSLALLGIINQTCGLA